MAPQIETLLFLYLKWEVKALDYEVSGQYPASKGELWPAPYHQEKQPDSIWLYDPSFEFETGTTCTKLEHATKRYKTILDNMYSLTKQQKTKRRRKGRKTNGIETIATLKIELNSDNECDGYPPATMDEGYGIEIGDESRLHAAYIWGILRGLESFTQMFYLANNHTEMRINGTVINDKPNYIHRGVMIDTGKHFLSMKSIFATINALEMNKMNVLHWRLTDDESFPYEIYELEKLVIKGAFYPDIHYTKNDITAVIDYASLRGIRVIPEVAMPGHAASIALAFPFMNSGCYDGQKFKGYGPLNVANHTTYRVLRQIFAVVEDTFPDAYIHLSGNDINTDCWRSDPKIKLFMEDNEIKTTNDLLAMFVAMLPEILSGKKSSIIWQEIADADIYISNGTVQIWKDYVSLNRNLKKGYSAIFSTCWSTRPDEYDVYWEDFYNCDLTEHVQEPALMVNVTGGEGLMWSTTIDDTNIMSKLWPANSAVAERLWSPALATKEALPRSRIEEHVCRMLRRGIHARPPNGPGFCFYRPHRQHSDDTLFLSQQGPLSNQNKSKT